MGIDGRGEHVMKAYCTQNNGDCSTCSLVNYGQDCHNYPLKRHYHIGEYGLLLLRMEQCPFCEGPLEDCEGFYEDGPNGLREGGKGTCDHCNLFLSWIDSPFEYDVEEDEYGGICESEK